MITIPQSSAEARIAALPNDDHWAVGTAAILLEACHDSESSDLHLTPQRENLLARARRDGELHHIAKLPVSRAELLVARFKVLARLPAFVKHEPQDGRIEWRRTPAEAPRQLRVSFLPTLHGESMVVRFPEQGARLLSLDALGMAPAIHEAACNLLNAQEGVILVTGPSGSGKTTTLYAMMQHLNAMRGDRLNFVTIENPIERDLGFASQVQVSDAQGLSFDTALRSALRQDPNVLLIGEIRDLETARTAAQAGLTGHLVLSTLHAGRASRIFTRILSLGLDPYLVASAFVGSMAQRLVRVLCAACKHPVENAAGFQAVGCEECNFTGCRGRAGIFEILPSNEMLREVILTHSSADQIKRAATQALIGDLLVQVRELVALGTISQREHDFVFSSEDGIHT